MADVDLYGVLGVTPGADVEDIKAQFRRLAREFHPDVHPDKLAAHERFVEISNAYQTLSDPVKREAYDRARRMEQAAQEAARAASVAEQAGQRRREQIDALIRAAELYFFSRQVRQAVELCQQVLRLDPENAGAYGLLGDIYRDMGRNDDALLMYSYAVHHAPRRYLYKRRLEELTTFIEQEEARRKAKAGASPTAPEPLQVTVDLKPAAPVSFAARAAALVSAVLVAASLVGVWLDAGPLFGDGVPLYALIAAAVDGFLLGMAMTLLHWMGHVDEELFSVSLNAPGGALPVGLLLGLTGIVWFPLSVVFYFLIAYFEEHWSPSILRALGATLLLLAALALLCPSVWHYTLLFGGNVVFTTLLIGWCVGSMFRGRW